MINRSIREFHVRDFETSFSFYTNYLGFRVMGDVTTSEHALLVREEVQLCLQVAKDIKEIDKNTHAAEQEQPLSFVNTLFRFNEIKSIYERLQKDNIRLYQEPQIIWLTDKDDIPVAGLFEFSVVDPDRNQLVFAQELLPSESFLPFEERMQPIRSMQDLSLKTSATEKTMAFTDALLRHLPEKMQACLHPCYMTYFDHIQTLQLVFDTSRHMQHMLYLLNSKQAFMTIVRRVFGENIRIEIISLLRQDESLKELEEVGSVMYLPIAADKSVDFQRQIDVQLSNMGIGHRSEAPVRGIS